MPDCLAELNMRLGQLLPQIMKEADAAKYDELGAETWQALGERERLTSAQFSPEKTKHR
jgi:hypothetical protein